MSKSLTYYDQLVDEALGTGNYENIPKTDITRLLVPTADELTNGTATSIRAGSITTLLPFSYHREAIFDITMGISAYLAARDFNDRKSVFLRDEDLQALQACDFYMTMHFRDTIAEPAVAVQEFYKDFMAAPDQGNSTNNNSSNATTNLRSLRSFATLGPLFSDSAISIAGIAPFALNPLHPASGSQGIINMSPGAGSDVLDNTVRFPYFARTISYFSGLYTALVYYLRETLNVKDLAVLYPANDYGRTLLNDFVVAGNKYGVKIHVFSYTDDGEPLSLQPAIDGLKKLPVVYHCFLGDANNIVQPTLELYDNGMMGTNQDSSSYQRVWFVAHTSAKITASQTDRLDDLNRAFHGTFAMVDDNSQSQLDKLMTRLLEFKQDPSQVEDFLSHHVGDSFFANKSNHLVFTERLHSDTYPIVSNVRARSYDGVMALGLAACLAQDDDTKLRTPALHKALSNVSFHGASGPVAFLDTGTRDPAASYYMLVNFYVKYDNVTNSTKLDQDTVLVLSLNNGIMKVENPIRLSDNSTTMPPPLAPITENQNLVSQRMRIFCWCICVAALLCSLSCAIWTILRRHRRRVKARQPPYLGLFCLGTFLMGSTIVPWTWQEPMPERLLNVGCMLNMWLIFIGSSFTFAALFAGTRRINMIFQQASSFRRQSIQAKDVFWVPLSHIIANLVLLSLWSVLQPLRWERMPIQTDYFDRVTDSYGTCFSFESQRGKRSLVFMLLLIFINGFAILGTAIQSYGSRFLPSLYNEKFHLAISSTFMLESMLLGIPLLASLAKNPTGTMVIGSWVFAINIFAVLLPLFVPMFLVEEGFIEDKNEGENLHEILRQAFQKSRSEPFSSLGVTRSADSF